MFESYRMHVVSHTHWDREWYRAFQQFRMTMVDLIDSLIDILQSNDEYRHFHLDGQTIVLDDYIEIRPEKADALRKLITDGRILIGPWYNQPDEFLPSGESLIRNLMLGKRMGLDWGNWMPIGYVPDSFGHTSQFPQIMRGFGIDSVVFFRGITTDQVESEFTWRSPDGSDVLGIKLPDTNAYSNFWYRLYKRDNPTDENLDLEKTRKQILDLVADCEHEKPTTSNLLFMDGVDHVFPNPHTPEIIKDANENLDVGILVHTTLPEYVDAMKSENAELGTVEGELRWSNRKWKLQALLTNVASSRIYLKQANHEVQTLLEKWAEPFSTVNWMLGKDYPSSYLNLAWKYLLQNHPHDSICGCSVDQVHQDMMYRFDQARLIAQEIADKSMRSIADSIDTSGASEDSLGLIVFNPLSWERSEVVETLVSLPNEWDENSIKVIDEDGNKVPFRMLGLQERWVMNQHPYGGPWMPPCKWCKLIFFAEGVRSVGYKTYFLEKTDKTYRMPGSLITGINAVENEHIALRICADGTLTITDKQTDQTYSGLMAFEDGGDYGDGYLYKSPVCDTVVSSIGFPAQISVVEDNLLRATFRVRVTMRVSAHSDAEKRSSECVDLPITSYVTLMKGSCRVDIVSEVENTARDHRLRVLFPSGINTDFSDAECAFDVVSRSIKTPDCGDWIEPMPSTHPHKSFVDVSDGRFGLAMINEGLPEYEVKDDSARTIALTLMRATGNGVGGREQQVGGQLIGTHCFRYAIYPHAGGWLQSNVWRQAWAHNVPVKVTQTESHKGELPLSRSFLSTGKPEVVLSALKKADRSDEIVARVFNFSDSTIDCCEMNVSDATNARQTDLNEDTIGEALLAGEITRLDIGARKIMTLAAEPVRLNMALQDSTEEIILQGNHV